MTSTRPRTNDPAQANAYPEPPACSAWGKSPQPTACHSLSSAEQDRNRQELAQAVHTRRHHKNPAESD
ncbi:hypothetical protein [Streptomyces sp. WMMB303]|uniref:hypothetical protein n=1 Tax=Streptomyces sp. WMMB303 TaxID=3034154 RepID=UPI0023EBC7D4|nr:hypothetical protein [Streptomyces sp. WMMB303]MDF4254636.1 hypothetical protein [Streptomyces sp. WMMB303]